MNYKQLILVMALVLSISSVFFGAASSFTANPPKLIKSPAPLPTITGTFQKVLEINFTVNSSNEITLTGLDIKNLPEAVVGTGNSDFSLEITDASNNVLFHSNILVILDPSTGTSVQYFAIPYPSGARFLNFYYKGNKIAQYDVPQLFPMFYIIVGIVAAVILVAAILIVYYIRKNHTVQT